MTDVQQKIKAMKHGGKILGNTLNTALEHVTPGVTEIKLNDIADEYITQHGGYPGFKKVPGYKHAVCVATNDVVVHGIPKERVLKDGDIICIDVGVFYDGYHTDMGETVRVWNKESRVKNKEDDVDTFLKVGKETLWEAIRQAKPGNRIGHISQVVQNAVEGAGYSVVRNLVGHGVGKQLHEKPEVPGVLSQKIEKTPLIKPGMTLAIEVIYNMGKPDIEYDGSDDWTIVTADGSLSAVFERTIVVTEKGPQLLTRLPSDPVI